jgi:hypothetical protein
LYDRCTGGLLAEKTTYERKSLRFLDRDVQSAVSYSESKNIAGKAAEWRDTETVGLTLRITPKKVVWYVRRREMTLRLGPTSEMDLDAARYFGEQTHLAAKRKRNLREFVETLVQMETTSKYKDRLGHAEIADRFADETSLFAYRKRIGDTGISWTWKALTNKFFEYQKPKLKSKYRKQHEHYLTLKEFRSIDDKLVCEIKLISPMKNGRAAGAGLGRVGPTDLRL